ncbi:MAG: D-alanyl-D-alanine carboxypeptidase/D-alanyl-D-alanine-endopeptidase [Bacteroidales bacterium]|nr:D-alanyl-D-alanine carboxypeptidase/D-alanyl-D-alanine-endopeptidase [Bacteroidales bacterium]
MRSIFSILFCYLAFFGTIQSASSGPPSPLKTAINEFRNDPALINANWSIHIADITSGEEIFSHNIHKPLLQASVQKILTTSAAMMMLGSDFQYETVLQYDGNIDRSGVLQGNLYIKGSGDPTLGAVQFDDTLNIDLVFGKWVDVLKDLGVKEISGSIIADERVFDNTMIPPRWLWGHIGNYFGAGASGLSVHENEYTVYFNAGAGIGSPAHISKTEPYVPAMHFINEVTTGPANSGDQVYIFGAPFAAERWLTGTIPLGARDFAVRGSLPDPPAYLAESFRLFLQQQDISVGGHSATYRTLDTTRMRVSDERTTVHTLHSPYLFDIIYRTNINSSNSYAENLLKTLASHSGRERASFDDGIEVLLDHWAGMGMNNDQLMLYDGSGLSPSNRITTAQMMTALSSSAGHPAFPVLLHSLPLAGYSGSLVNQFRGTVSEGLLRAKSGYLLNVRSYAGYTTMRNGHLAAFVIVANDYNCSPAAMRLKMMHLMNAITLHSGQQLDADR